MQVHEIIAVLQQGGEIAHWSMHPGRNGDLSCPPIITWRYKQPTKELAELICLAVDDYRGVVAWDFSGSERTWCLMPLRVRELARLHEGVGGLGAAAELMRVDPDFGRCANKELCLFAEHLQQHLGKAWVGEQILERHGK